MKILTNGFGQTQGLVAIYIEHCPPMQEYKKLKSIHSLSIGEVNMINQASGNGWRKIFNVYAKILGQLRHSDHNFTSYDSWQDYRDKCLLQSHSQEALLFSPPQLGDDNYRYHVIAGRTYAKQLLRDHIFTNSLVWLDEEFAVDKRHNLVVCPFLDYRQLSNIKISKLCDILSALH
ncbi:hypothetical protein PSECIP111951_03184 [Pseudoalteromonas holothuriae]|uniref:Uncharacterized protein n=1 Tax=Pseudoalteromonas holothuriae TaxID=2963714 RepID=A0A9W4R272_9GAMM|nr:MULTISPECIES: hypothetical protein [unclassified Pseudoalteromonas]CAH9063768.1 hypothetical protein PSECIP111854_03289 [Pseudoalteromonas sp. CIP111854]CAH9064652.1 hypothetical protein PSECIP111951_03184 [Pseudoalteromonas sp. CIP111951]